MSRTTTGGRSRRTSIGALILAAAILAAAGALAFVAIRGPARASTPQERTRQIAASLRCPVCQDLSVADSPSTVAREMRAAIGRDLTEGLTPDQIRARFVASYGQWILLSPPRRGINLVAWVAPLLLLVGGLLLAVVAVRRWTLSGRAGGGPAPAPPGNGGAPVDRLSESDRRLLDRALASAQEEPE
jgi:cytochrome c-type biogenesis protein CcmH